MRSSCTVGKLLNKAPKNGCRKTVGSFMYVGAIKYKYTTFTKRNSHTHHQGVIFSNLRIQNTRESGEISWNSNSPGHQYVEISVENHCLLSVQAEIRPTKGSYVRPI